MSIPVDQTAAEPARLAGSSGSTRGQNRFWRYATIAPAVLVFALLTVLPLALLVIMMFYDIAWSGGVSHWTYVGARHILDLPHDVLFRAGAGNTAVFALVAVVAEIVIGFALALLTSKVMRGRILYRTVFLLPVLVPGIVIGAIWQLMYNVDFGVINQLLGLVGIAGRDWLGNKNLALGAVIGVDIWHWTPFCFLLLLAGIESLPEDIYEAARVDGVGFWTELRHLTLPLMAPTILVTLIFRLVVAVKVFDEVYLLTGGGPGTATEVVSFTIYRRFFTEDRTGIASAMSVATLLAVFLVLILAMGIARGRGRQS